MFRTSGRNSRRDFLLLAPIAALAVILASTVGFGQARGTAHGWGNNGSGQLGAAPPIQVRGLAKATASACVGYHSLALLSEGTVMAWGWNFFGQLGNGTTTNRSRRCK